MCSVLDGSGYDMAIALIAREVLSSIDWLAVAPETAAQLLLSSVRPEIVSAFTNEGANQQAQER